MSPKTLVPKPAAKKKPAGRTGTAGNIVAPKPKRALRSALPDPRSPEALEPARPVGNLQHEAYEMLRELRSVETIEERVAIYRHAGKRLVFLAARLWPRLMPMLNGEFEFIALSSADVE